MAISSIVSVNIGQAFSPPSNEVAAEARPAPAPLENALPSPARSSAQGAQAPQAANASPKELREAAEKINKALQTLNSSSLEFSVDDDTGRTIVRVVDIETKDVIRQIPNEEALAIAKSLDKLQGVLIRQKA